MPNDKIVKLHGYLKSQNITVPDDVSEFESGLTPERMNKLHSYLKDNDVVVPESSEDFGSSLGLKKKEQSGSDSGIPGIPSASSGQDNQTGTSAIGLTKGGQKAPQETEAQRKAKYPTGTYLQKEAIPTNITDAAPPVKPTVKDQSDPAFVESVKNTTSNIGNSLSGVVPRLKLVSADVWQGLLGKDLADKWYETENRDLNQEREGALNKLKQLKEEVKPTRGIVESFEKGDKTGFAAAVVDAAGSLVSTAIPSLATGGAGLFTESIGTAIADHNEEKAKEMGVTTKELYDSGNASLRTPLVIGTLSGALENVGLKGIGKFINKKITSTGVKKVGEIFGDFNKEGLTEWVQVGLDKFNTETAKGKDATEASSEAASQMFSKDGLEAYAKGIAGAGVAGVAGKGLKSLIVSPKEQSQTEPSVSPELQNKLALTPTTEPELLGRKQGGQPVYKEQNGGQVQNETQQPSPDSGGTEQNNAQAEPVKSDVQPVSSEVNQGVNAPEQATPTLTEPVSTVQHIEQAIQEHGLTEGAKLLNEDTGLAQRRINESTNNPDPNALNQASNSNSSVAGSESAEPGRTEPEMADSTDTGSEDGKNNEGSVRGEKKAVLNRAYKGQTETQIREAIEKYGLTYEVESHLASEEIADGIIADIGIENALEAVRKYEIHGAPALLIFSKGINSFQKEINSETDGAKLIELLSEQSKLINELDNLARNAGRQSSVMQYIYDKSDFNFDFERQVKQFKENNGGIIPKEIEDKMRNLDTQLKDVVQKLKEAEEKVKALEEQAAVDNIKKDIAQKSPEKKKRKGKILISEGVNELAEALGITLMAAGDQKASVTKALAKIGRGMIEEGIATIDNVADKLKAFVQEKFSGKIDYDQYNEDVLAEITTEPTSGGKVKVKQSLIRKLIEEGAENIDELVSDVKDNIKEEYPDATDRDIRDAITSYGRTINPSKDEIDIKLGKMKRIGRLISQLEDVRAKKRPLKSGLQREKADADERALAKELREAMKELPMDQETMDKQLKTAMDATKQRLKNQIEDLNREIASKEKTPESTKVFRDDEELLDLKKTRDELKKQHDEIFKDEDFILGKKIEIAKRNAEKKIADYQKRISERDYEKRPRARFEADKELNKLRIRQLELKDDFSKLQYENELKNRTKTQKAIDFLFEAWGLTRALRATGEMSFILLQGGIQTLSHPKNAVKAFVTAMSHFASEKRSDNWLRELRTTDSYQRMKESRLALAEPNSKLTVREEQFLGGWVNHIWDFAGYPIKLAGERAYNVWKKANPIKAVERSGVGYMNTLRVERYLQGEKMLQMQGKSIIKDKEDFKNMSDVINTLTGRASIGSLEGASKILSSVFFSPRNWMSTIKTVTPYAFYHFGKMTTKDALGKKKVSVAQKMAMRDFMSFVGVTGSIVMLAALNMNDDEDKDSGVEFDPTSSDFMKIKMGDTRIDPWGGKIQHIILQSRIFSQSMKKADGKSHILGYKNTDNSGELALRVATNKFAPSMSMLWKLAFADKKKINGKIVSHVPFEGEYDASEQFISNLYPIYWDSIREIYKDQPDVVATFLSFLAFMGLGVNAYEDKKKK